MNTTEHIEKTTAQPPKKDGFKQTEVGLIPEDWILISYGDAFDFLSSATYSRAELSLNGDIGYIHYGDIHTKWLHFIDLEKNNLPTILEKQKKSYSLVKEGDLVLADASEDYEGIGSSVEVINLKNKKIISGLHTFLLRDKNQIFAPRFKGYINSNLLVKAQIDRLATGLKVYGISRSNLRLVLIPLPPTLVEQRAIATALSDMDALIAAQEALISKKRSIKQGAMQELLKPKEGWEEKKLGDCLSHIVGGGTPSRSVEEFWNGKIPWVTVKDFTKHNPNMAQEYITEKGLSQSASHLIPKGTLITSTRMALGQVVIYNVDVSINQDLKALFVKRDISKQYLKYWFELKSNYIQSLGSGSTVMGISLKELKGLKIYLPSGIAQQITIATALSDMDTEIERLEGQLAKYREMKKGMMQELLTGKKRLV